MTEHGHGLKSLFDIRAIVSAGLGAGLGAVLGALVIWLPGKFTSSEVSAAGLDRRMTVAEKTIEQKIDKNEVILRFDALAQWQKDVDEREKNIEDRVTQTDKNTVKILQMLASERVLSVGPRQTRGPTRSAVVASAPVPRASEHTGTPDVATAVRRAIPHIKRGATDAAKALKKAVVD